VTVASGQRPVMCYVTATLMTFDKPSNGRRTAVESKSNRLNLNYIYKNIFIHHNGSGK